MSADHEKLNHGIARVGCTDDPSSDHSDRLTAILGDMLSWWMALLSACSMPRPKCKKESMWLRTASPSWTNCGHVLLVLQNLLQYLITCLPVCRDAFLLSLRACLPLICLYVVATAGLLFVAVLVTESAAFNTLSVFPQSRQAQVHVCSWMHAHVILLKVSQKGQHRCCMRATLYTQAVQICHK